MMSREQKKNYITEMESQFQNNEAILVTHYQGLTMSQLDELRSQMREHGIKFKITKNRITKLALEKTKCKDLSNLFTGATASIRGGSGFSAFAGAKFALRALSQSMARELGPEGIHVAHMIIDGAIDTPWIKENFPDRYALKEKDGILSPAKIAETYWNVHSQDRSAWTQELDLRPYLEKF